MANYRTRYWIIALQIVEQGQIIEFSDKIPSQLKNLKAVIVHASRNEGDLEDIDQIGEVSIQLNSKKIAPIHLIVEYNKRPKDYNEFELDEKIEANQMVSGYYRDHAKTMDSENRFLPYSIKIYFKCKTLIN
jgi:hypothetical protein